MEEEGQALAAVLVVAMLVAFLGGLWLRENSYANACEAHCAPYAIDESADICQCQQVSPAIVAEDCGQ